MKNLNDLNLIKSKIAQCGQKIYDEWCQNEEGFDELVGYGGICHLIADEIVNLLHENDIDCTTMSSSFEVHVFVIAKLDEGVFKVDIPYYLYENGGGYNWTKMKNIVFQEDFVVVEQLSYDSEDFEKEYCDDF